MSKAVSQAQSALQSLYCPLGDKPIVRSQEKKARFSLNSLFINLAMIIPTVLRQMFKQGDSFGSSDDRERAEYVFGKAWRRATTLLRLHNVFTATEGEEMDPARELVVGGAGCGKSVVFTKKAPFDWARGKLWQQFVLVFIVHLCDKTVWQAKTVAQLLKLGSVLGLDDDDQNQVQSFIKTNPKRVLVICDGLDEGSVKKDSLLWHMLRGNSATLPSSMSLLVTSRPCSLIGEIDPELVCFDRRLELTGFTRDDVASFAQIYLGSEAASESLLTELDKFPSAASLVQTPYFCELQCEHYQQYGSLPRRQSDMFQSTVLRVLQRYSRVLDPHCAFTHIRYAPVPVQQLLTQLAKLAWAGLRAKQLYFTTNDLVKASIPNAVLELGLLVKVENSTSSEGDLFAFHHLTLQEYLAAHYVATEQVKSAAGEEQSTLVVGSAGTGPQANAGLVRQAERAAEVETPAQRVQMLMSEVELTDGHLRAFWVFLAGMLDTMDVEVLLTAMAR